VRTDSPPPSPGQAHTGNRRIAPPLDSGPPRMAHDWVCRWTVALGTDRNEVHLLHLKAATACIVQRGDVARSAPTCPRRCSPRARSRCFVYLPALTPPIVWALLRRTLARHIGAQSPILGALGCDAHKSCGYGQSPEQSVAVSPSIQETGHEPLLRWRSRRFSHPAPSRMDTTAWAQRV
jgi:hypothetical protein